MADEATFQFTPAASTAGSIGAQGAAPTLGISGGQNTVDTLADRFVTSENLGAGSQFPAFLEEAFAPKIKAAQDALYWKGFTQATMGRSQAEISEDVPWYAKVFGPVPYELGAEKYTIDKATADLDTYFINEMPRLQTMPTEDVAKEMQQKAMQQVGDDPYTSSLLKKAMMDRMGPMLDVHTKSRYAWEQKELVQGQQAAIAAAGESLDATRRAYAQLGKDAPNEAEVGYQNEQMKRNYLAAWVLPEFQSAASKEAAVKGAIIAEADAGHFSGLMVLHESGALGDVLSPEELSTAERYIESKWSDFKSKALLDDPAMYERIVKTQVAAAQGLGGEATTIQMQEINKEWQAKYGYKGFFEQNQMVGGAVQSENAWISEENANLRANIADAKTAGEKEAAERAKAEADARNSAALAKAVMLGQKAQYEFLKGVEPGDVDRIFTLTYDQMKITNPTAAAQMLVWNRAEGAKMGAQISQKIQADMGLYTSGGAINDAFLNDSYATWLRMREGTGMHVDARTGELTSSDTIAGPATAADYYGKENNARMERFHQLYGNNHLDANVAYQATFGADPSERPVIEGATPKETKALRAEYKNMITSFDVGALGRVFGSSIQLGDSGAGMLSQALANELSQSIMAGGNPEFIVKNAFRSAQNNGLEKYGGFVWQTPRNTNQKSLAAHLHQPAESIGPAVDRAIRKSLKSVYIDYKDDTPVAVYRMPDVGGQPELIVTALDSEGQYVSTYVHLKDIQDEDTAELREREALEARLNKPLPVTQQFPARAGGRNSN